MNKRYSKSKTKKEIFKEICDRVLEDVMRRLQRDGYFFKLIKGEEVRYFRTKKKF
jgi:hypothetical protein